MNLLLGRILPRGGGATLGHALFVVLLVAGAAVRLAALIAYRPALTLQRDAIVYLRTAIGSNVSPNTFRPALYSVLFLRPLLAFDELSIVTIAQHALGLGLAIALYLFLVSKSVHAVAAALAMAPMLLDGYQVNIEHYILAETFFDALVVAGLLLLAWWRAQPPIAACVLAGLLLGTAGLTRFVGLVLIAPAVLYVVWRGAGWLRIAAVVLGFAIPVLSYSQWSESGTGTTAVTGKTGFFLYGRVASFADCRHLVLPKDLRRFCLDEPPAKRGPVYGFWTLEPIQGLTDDPQTNGRLLEFDRRVIADQPLQYAAAVARDLFRNVSPGPPISKEPLAAKWRFPRTLADADAHPVILALGGSAPPRMGFDEFRIERPLADRLRAYQNVVYTRGPLLAVLLLLGLVGSIIGLRRPEGNLRADCVLFTTSSLALLLAPVMVTVYHFRYSLPALPVAGAAAGLGVACILGRIGKWRRAPAWKRQDADSQESEPL